MLSASEITYSPSDLIGEGSSGTVYKAKWLDEATVVAVKILKTQLKGNVLEQFQHEVSIWTPLKHPNILACYGTDLSHAPGPMLVLEYAPNGSLYEYMQSNSMLMTSALAHKFISQIASGMLYLHTRNPVVLHGDLKSLNVLLMGNLEVKLTDFGLSRLRSMDTVAKQQTNNVTGTLRWMPHG
ncbi:hypothetical protein HK096_006429 [Nowakowskiella sp. JEL0078]|nr:hypothetical protein HK096_006429 [Nowakowskiella sp. JEL0078]